MATENIINGSYETLDNIINTRAVKSALIAGAFTTLFGYLMDSPLENIILSSLTFGAFTYGITLVRLESTISKIAGIVVAGVTAIPAYFIINNIIPAVFGKLYTGIISIATGAYTTALKPFTAVAIGVYLGYSLLRNTYLGIKNLFGFNAYGNY